jgi:subtilisin family serine protease
MSTGTSVAAAHVSGVVALLLALQPTLTPDAVRKLLLSTATDLGPKGRDDKFGAGLTDAHRAILSLAANISRVKPADVSAAR